MAVPEQEPQTAGDPPLAEQPRTSRAAETWSLPRGGADSTAAWTPPPTKEENGPPAARPRRLGRFELRERLGGGSFGEVFRAYDPRLDRVVALKIARQQSWDGPEDLERFFREARAAAQFQHPHIVQVYEVGQEDSTAYIVAALVEGRTLAQALAARRFSPAESVRLVLELADALHYAHLRGVFHRDIKPGNVLLDEEGKTFLADFGLARRLEGEALRTMEGEVLGTPAYMSPEQARGNSREVDARSDLYSLGVVLYELLTGQRPFTGSVYEVLQAVRDREPPPPRRIAGHVPQDLEAICLKAMAKDPGDRYPSVEHFADDLRRWQRSEPVRARNISPVARGIKWSRRNPAATAAAVILISAAAGFAGYWQTRPAWLDLRVLPAGGETKATLDGQPLALDDKGRALVSHPPGRYRLLVSAPGHESAEQDVVLIRGRGNAAVASIELDPRFGYLSLTSDPEGAAVELTDGGGKIVATGTTPFHSPRLPSGDYTARINRELYAPDSVRVTVPTADRVGTAPAVKLKPQFENSSGYDFIKRVKERLKQPIQPVEFLDTPLRDAFQALAAQEKVMIVLDSRAMDNAGISADVPVTRQLPEVSLEAALKLLLSELELTYVVQQNSQSGFHLQITTQEAAETRLTPVVFAVRDLVGPEGDFDSLIERIESNIAPTSWDNVGGPGSLTLDTSLAALTISQSWGVLVAVDDYLTQLREAKLAAAAKSLVNPDLERAVAIARRLGAQVARSAIEPGEPITKLDFTGTAVTDDDLAGFPACPHLRQAFFHSTRVTSAGIEFLKHSPQLERVSLGMTQIDGKALEFIASAPRLTLLSMPGVSIPDTSWKPLESHPGLIQLHLQNVPIGDVGVRSLKTMPNLRELNISGSRVTDSGLMELADHPNIHLLHLRRAPCGDPGVAAVAARSRLMGLSLPAQATDAALQSLAQAKSLSILEIADCQVTLQGLAELKNIPQLRSLTLRGRIFDDAAIEHLGACANLRVLTLQNCRITKDGIARLRSLRPDLVVNGQIPQ